MKFSASDIAREVGGSLVGPDVAVEGAGIDSRTILPGQLFVPLVAERNGHNFIDAARKRGAAAYLTSERPGAGPAIVVHDTRKALWDLAAAARDRLADRVIGITGSVGKTTVKDLVAGGLVPTLRTYANVASFNNEIGAPLTLLCAPDDTEALVVEMGARFPGDIALLCGLARPTIGVITAIRKAHVAGLGGLEGVAKEKASLIEALPADGVAVLNDEDCGPLVRKRTKARIITFGTTSGDVRAKIIARDENLRCTISIESPWGTGEATLGVRGDHQAYNAAAAVAVCVSAGVDLYKALQGIESAAGSPWRMEFWVARNGLKVLNDSYNANPASMRAALQSFAKLPAERHVAVLGTMAELGDDSEMAHREAGELAASLGIEVISLSVPQYCGETFSDPDEIARIIDGLGSSDAVLFKASRVAGLDQLADRLRAAAEDPSR